MTLLCYRNMQYKSRPRGSVGWMIGFIDAFV
jgi:hypothetical protein